MNPFNVVWIVLTGMLAATGIVAGFAQVPPALLAWVIFGLWLLIVGQTVGCDRAERAGDADRAALKKARESHS